MTLLDQVLEASGGLGRWNELSQFTLHLSFGGTLLSHLGRAGDFKDVISEGSTRTQSLRFIGILGGERSGSFQPDQVTIEDSDGRVLRTWHNPNLVFPDRADNPLDQELRLIFFCGLSVWNYVATPFLLSRPDIHLKELTSWHENDQIWRRLRATFPPDIVTYSTEQIFYFDERGMQRRTDHILLGIPVAHYSWAHQAFGGIVVPTLRRSLTRQPDGTVIRGPALIDLEIFDAAFE
jgi:hypothetical protein